MDPKGHPLVAALREMVMGDGCARAEGDMGEGFGQGDGDREGDPGGTPTSSVTGVQVRPPSSV